ncbi:MAG: hypothetical protein HY689_15260 [Chloroflexi bacterium]|nr:hypothetical protein [Chloroflexota bacterium]
MDTLTAPAPDLLDASPAAAVMPPLAEQLGALRQQHHSALEEIAALRAGKAGLERRVSELEAEVREADPRSAAGLKPPRGRSP